MGLVHDLLVAGAGAAAGAAVGAGLTYAAGVRTKQRDLESDAIELLEEALTEMQVHVLNKPLPWAASTHAELLHNGQRAIGRARPRLEDRHAESLRRTQRVVAMFAVGARTAEVYADNYHACFDSYADAAFDAIRHFYSRRTPARSTLPNSREIQRSAAFDPTLRSLRDLIEP